MNDMARIDRRSFLASVAAVGGSLALGFEIPFGPQPVRAADGAAEINAWVVIEPKDTVVIRVAKSEMGQGSFTALSMLVAEELECDWSKVKAEFAPPHENLARNRVWGDMSTGGSRAVRSSHEYLRKAGATAREMLIAAAALQWGVSASECRAEKSVITHMPSGRTVGFGEVAEAAARIAPPRDVKLKDPKDWKIAGKPTRRLEIIDKVQGKTTYGIDVRLPNMLYAALIQCPVFKGTLKSADGSKIDGMKGVRKVVKLKDAVAVVADSWWQAKQAVEALPVAWDDGGNGRVSSDTIMDFLRTGLASSEAGVGRRDGNVREGLANAARRVEAEYSVPFLSHATMEPQNCTASVSGDKVEIWVSTQNGEASLAAAAQAAGVSPRNVIVHKTMLGGGFGRRDGVQDFIPHAVLIAKEMGQPVKTVWTREEDMRHDYYRPVAMTKMVAGLDASGRPIAWHVRMTGNSIRGTLTPQAITNGVDTHFQEGFLEEMPYDIPHYLADYAQAGKFAGVLDAAAKLAGWGSPPPQGVHRGIALEAACGTYVAGVAEASVSDRGEVRLHRVVCALDPGHVVNPLTVELQTESAIVYGLTAALYGEITIKDGRVQQSNFNDYQMLRIAQMPKVETIIMPSGGFWGGCGEPPVSIVAPALCNAIFAATGKRIRSLPLKNHDLRKA